MASSSERAEPKANLIARFCSVFISKALISVAFKSLKRGKGAAITRRSAVLNASSSALNKLSISK